MKKILEKNEFILCMFLIVMYIVTNSYCIQNFGLYNYKSVVVNTLLSILLIILMIILKRLSYYGLAKVNNLKNLDRINIDQELLIPME